MDIKEQIIKYCNMLGLDLIGFTPCREFNELKEFYKYRKENNLENEFEETCIKKRINPNYYMEEGKTIVSIAFPYLHERNYKNNGFSIYTRGLDYHNVVKSYLDKICKFIEDLGGKAMSFVDSNTLPERYIAYLSGIGFIGKNNMLITKKYGSFVFLGEIITDLNIPLENNKLLENTPCIDCDKCYRVCPTNSINDTKKNCNICMSYITQKKDIDDEFLRLMKGRIFGCDSCQLSCPCNHNISYSNVEEFKPLNFMKERIDTEDIISLNNKDFKETFKITSCGWRGKNTLIRNALIKRYLIENKSIEEYNFESPYLKAYKNRLLMLNKV
ncbi:MAG: tRNA epoxyqueuosine(34) reductase QueG [Clostridium perfringens]|nr:tRNA epoxyqueuosine(34) reductase QueG [Clostridium perfringens]